MRRIALALALLTFAPAPSAHADWEVKRSEFDPKLVARYKQLVHQDPDDATALRKLVELYRKHKTLDQLSAELEKAGDLVAVGHLARERGKPDEAARWYEKALAGGDKRARVHLADEQLRLKRWADARTLYDAALKDGGNRAPLLRKRIEVDLQDPGLTPKERIERTRPLYLRLLVVAPADEAARTQLAELEAAVDPARAAALWRQIANQRRGDPAQRGQALLRVGQFEEAAQAWQKALAVYDEVYALAPKGHYLRREAMVRMIEVHRRLDNLRKLAEQWEKAWPPASRGFVEWEALAALWDELGDATRAEEALKRALAADPHQIETRRRLIGLYERGGRAAEALSEYRKLVQTAPGEPRFRLELAERLWRFEPGSKEALALARAVGRETRNPSVHQALAELFSRWGLTDEALAEREKLVQLEPNEEAHLVNLGELYWSRGKKDKAVETWKRILGARGEKREKLEARLGDVYGEHDLPNEALEAYQRAAKLAPDDLTVQKGLAGALERMHRDAEAAQLWEELYERAAATKSRGLALEVRQRMLSTLMRLNRLNAKLPLYRQRLDTAADDEQRATWGLLCSDGYLRLGRAEEAEKVLTTLTDRLKTPQLRGEAFLGLAQVLKARHRLKEAIAALEKAAELEPQRARELYAQIAELSLQLYRDADALTYAQKAVELGPGDAAAHLRLAEVLEKRDQIDQAAAQYQRALELNDRQWKVYFVLARLQLRRGDYAQAARLYREVLRRAPEEELVVDAARRAIDLDEYLGSLGELERELAPLSYAHADRRVYRKLLVDLYERYAPPLAARARAGDEAARKELVRLGEHGLRPLLEVLSPPDPAEAASGDLAERRMAASLLGEFGNASAVGPLFAIAAKRSKDAKSVPIELRVEAALSAARLAGSKDVPALAALAQDPEKQVRMAALWGLGRLRAPAAEVALEKALSDATPEAQALACLGLARARSTRGNGVMQQIVRDRNRAELVRAAAAFALGVVGGDGARPALTELLAEGSDEPQRKAAWALGRLGAPKPALYEAVFVRRDGVRRLALEALAGTPEPTFGEPERLLLADGGGLDVRGWVTTLGGSGRGDAPAAAWRGHEAEVARALEDALSRHRDLQLRALGDLATGLGPLAVEATDQRALDEIQGRLRPTLEKLAQKGDTPVRVAALRVLGRVRGGLPAVTRALADPAGEVRIAALQALGEAGAHPDDVREAAQAAGRIAGARDWRERRAALAAMPHGNASTAAGLALDDADGFVRETAAQVLGKVCGKPAPKGLLENLAKHVNDEAPAVRAAVAESLKRCRAVGD